MKKIMVPVSFSETSQNALHHAYLIASEYKATLSLLHCYPSQEYNRRYDFGKEDYDKGIRKMMTSFYKESIENSEGHQYILITNTGSVSDTVSIISPQYDLFVMSRKTGLQSTNNKYFSDKLLYISSKALCPVLITSTQQHDFSFQKARNIWHIKRNESGTDIVNQKIAKLGIDPKLVVGKSLQQDTFVSSFWKHIVALSKNHNKGLLKDISRSFEEEQVDLLILVNHRNGLFERFLKDDVFQIISQFDIPILILQASNPTPH